MPHVVSIVYTPEAAAEKRPKDRYARVPVPAAELVEGHGIAGDLKAAGGKRQVNVMHAETLAELAAEGFHTGPGEMGEQVVVAGIAPSALTPGARLRLGAAVVEVTLPRTGCDRFEHIQGKPKGLAAGRLGVMARVVAAGPVRVGDPAELVVPGPAGGNESG